jgi:hypothetical protein
MTDNEIIKALAQCSNSSLGCSGCPLFSSAWDEYGKSIAKCEGELIRYAFDLINRQNAEIEALTNAVDKGIEVCHECHGKYVVRVEKAKTEAVKEFAERLCDGRVSNDPIVIATRCLVKEMTEG